MTPSIPDNSGDEPVRPRLQVVPMDATLEPDATAVAPFRSAPPRVTLLREESTAHPVALTIAAAWSCYGARPAKVENVLKLIHGPAPADLDADAAADRAGRR